MPDRVRFREFAQVRSRNKTVSWQAGSEHDYEPIMDQPLADGRAVRVSEGAPHVEARASAPAGTAPEVSLVGDSAAQRAANAKLRAKPQ